MSIFSKLWKRQEETYAPPAQEEPPAQRFDSGLTPPKGVFDTPGFGFPQTEQKEPPGFAAWSQSQGQSQPRDQFDFSMGSRRDPNFTNPYTQAPASPQSHSKDFELISAKLDTIKSQLEAISARLARLERIAEDEKGKW